MVVDPQSLEHLKALTFLLVCTPSKPHAMPLLFHKITLQGQIIQNFPSYGFSKAGL